MEWYRTRAGALFSDSTVALLIRDPTAKGLHRANYTANKGSGQARLIKPEDEWVWTPVEPIISEELWDQCNRILEDSKRKIRRPGKRPVTLFGGLAYCHCGGKMYVPSKSPKYTCASCRNKIPIEDLDEIFYQQLHGYFLSPEKVAEHLTKADQNVAEKESQLRILETEHAKLQTEIQRVYQLYVEGRLTSDGFGKFYKPLEDRQKQLDEEIPRLQAEVDIFKINHLSADQILSEAKDLHSRWPSLSKDEKRKIVENITEKIIIGKGEVDITLCCVGPFEELPKGLSRLQPACGRRAD